MTTQTAPLLPTLGVHLDTTKSMTPQIVDDLKGRILSGQYSQGSPLPTVSALADSYGVSDQVLCNALTRLIAERYVTKEGYGRYQVAGIIPPVHVPEEDATTPVISAAPPVAKHEPVESSTTPASGAKPVSTMQYLLCCPTCGAWTHLPPGVIAAIAPEVLLVCANDLTVLTRLCLDPAKRIGQVKTAATIPVLSTKED